MQFSLLRMMALVMGFGFCVSLIAGPFDVGISILGVLCFFMLAAVTIAGWLLRAPPSRGDGKPHDL